MVRNEKRNVWSLIMATITITTVTLVLLLRFLVATTTIRFHERTEQALAASVVILSPLRSLWKSTPSRALPKASSSPMEAKSNPESNPFSPNAETAAWDLYSSEDSSTTSSASFADDSKDSLLDSNQRILRRYHHGKDSTRYSQTKGKRSTKSRSSSQGKSSSWAQSHSKACKLSSSSKGSKTDSSLSGSNQGKMSGSSSSSSKRSSSKSWSGTRRLSHKSGSSSSSKSKGKGKKSDTSPSIECDSLEPTVAPVSVETAAPTMMPTLAPNSFRKKT